MSINSTHDAISNCNIVGEYNQYPVVINGDTLSVIDFKNGITIKVRRQKDGATIWSTSKDNEPSMICKNLENPIITGSNKSDKITLYNCNRAKIDILNDSTTTDTLYIYSTKECDGYNISAGKGDYVSFNFINLLGDIIKGIINTSKHK